MRRGRGGTSSTGVALAGVLLACAASAAFGTVARAEQPATEEADDAAETETETVRVRGSAVGGFVSRGREGEMPRPITDTATLVETLPGVHVRRLGADDSFATMSVRGTSSAQVAVFLAGVPLTGGADPSLDLAALPLWPGAQVRVYRSFAPAGLGRGSLGGTLVLDPPSPRAAPRTEVWGAVGSFGARRLRVGDVRGDPEGVRVASAVVASRSDDDFTYLDPTATRARERDVLATRENAGHASANGLLSVALPVRFGAGRTGALTVTTLAQSRRQELPGTITRPTPFQRLESTRLVSGLELTAPLGAGTFGVRGWGRREGLSVRDALEDAQIYGTPTSTADAIVAAGSSVGWKVRPGGSASIEARIDGSGERFAPGAWLGAPAPPGARRTNAGAAIDAEARATSNLRLSASGRADGWFDTTDDGVSSSEARPTGPLGAELELGRLTFASHAGALARPPSFVERFGNRGAFLGERNLRSESAVTTDAGVRAALGGGKLRVDAEAAGFSTWAENLITYVNQGAYGRAKATNIGAARLVGAEALLRARAFGFEGRIAYTLLSTENLAECRYEGTRCVRPPLPGRPTHDLFLDLAYTIGPARFRYGVDVMSGMETDLQGQIPVPSRVLQGAGLTLAVPGVRGLTATFDVRNLFDVRAGEVPSVLGGRDRIPLGDAFEYPLPGRRFLLALAWLTR